MHVRVYAYGCGSKISDIEMPVLISDFYIVHTIDPFMK